MNLISTLPDILLVKDNLYFFIICYMEKEQFSFWEFENEDCKGSAG